ncbi:PAS domain S-box protein [Hydrotalea lipotrueae]|uniref:PAS domain S-box protein n=1 Tax=Hydrotalea lipotrueae TaxID=2803817 RepID=UPI0009456131|nr:PAS domain S-box protein [Hydrotalea lipotrueae]
MQEMYHLTILHAPLAVFLSKPDGTVLEANHAAAEMFGYSLEALRGMHCSRLIDENMPGFAELYEQRAKSGLVKGRFIGIKSNGEKFPVEMHSRLFTTTSGEQRASAIIADISERQQHAAVTQKLMAEMQLILNNTDESFIILDRNLNITAINASAEIKSEALLGKNLVVGHSILEYAQPERIPALQQVYSDVLAGHTHKTIIELPFEGSVLFYQIKYKPIQNAEGVVTHIMVNTMDVTVQKNIEKQLQELLHTSEYLKNIFEKERNYFINSLEQLADGFATFDATGKSTFLNSNGRRLLHLPLDGKSANIIEAIPGTERLVFEQVINNALQLQQSNVLEIFHPQWQEWMRYRIYPNQQETTLFFRSITHEVQVRQALETSEKTYKYLFYYNPQPMWIIHPNTKAFLEVNEMAVQKYGYSRAEFLQMTIYDLRDEQDARALQLIQRERKGSILAYQGLWKHRTKKGDWLEVEIISHLIEFNQQPAALILVNDVTERSKTRQQLLQSNERFEYVAQVSFNAIWDWDLTTGQMYWGDGYTELFGYPVNFHQGNIQDWKTRLHPDDAERVAASLQQAIDNAAEFWQEAYYYKKADGSWAYVIDRGKILKDENGKPYRMVGAMQDITLQKYQQSIQDIESLVYNLNLQQQVAFKDVVDVLLIELEKLHPGMLASVLTLQSNNTVQHLAAPHLPAAYLQAINGAPIGPAAGSCGTAMYTKERVIVDDIANDKRWKLYKEIALQYGLQACWSIPILNKNNTVLGSLAFYYEVPKTPTALQLQTLERMSKLVGIIMENHYNYLLLATNKLRYELIAKAASDALWDWNIANHTVELLGDGFEKLFGYPSEVLEWDRDFWTSHIHPDDLPNILKRGKLAFKNKNQNIWESEYRFKKSDGSYAFVRDKGFIIRNEDGTVSRMIGATEDITQRKMQEEELKRLSIVAKETTNAVIITDAHENITYVNEAFTKITGYTLTESIGKNARFLQGPDSDVAVKTYMRQQIAAQQPFECEIKNYTKSGEAIWLHIQVQPIFDEQKKLVQFFAIETDITEAKKTQEQLHVSEEKYKQLFDTNPNSIFVWDIGSLKILDVNNTSIKEYGYSREELLQMTILDLYPASEHETLKQFVRQIQLSDKIKYIKNWKHQKKDGSIIQMQIASHKIKYEGRDCVMGIGTNITEKLALEARLAEEQVQRRNEVIHAEITAQEKERQEIGRELHDNVNQILTASRIYVEMARKAHPEENELLQQSSWYILQAIEEIRKLSKALINPVEKDVSLKEAIRKLVNDMLLLLKNNVVIDLTHFNETGLEQKFRLNLYRIIQEQLTNISKHAAATKVKIQLKRNGSHITLRIVDNGKGFDVNAVKSGIGLNNIQKRTEMYKGKFTIQSSPGNGTVLLVDFHNI